MRQAAGGVMLRDEVATRLKACCSDVPPSLSGYFTRLRLELCDVVKASGSQAECSKAEL
jgi:hypothetical protein